ncbi:MAG TPA: hypothetical protein VN538_07660, partial [Clostridia bacterium]|nr:hypothetical protein [Clostridia bacterium]
MGRNMLFITGTNVERTSIKNYRQAISHDRDIKRLIKNGLFTLKKLPHIAFLFFFIFLLIDVGLNIIIPVILMSDPSLSVNKLISVLAPFDINLVSLTFAVVSLFLSLILFIIGVWDYVKDGGEKIKNIIKAWKLIFRTKSVSNPLELWDVLQASIMDAQITTSAERLFSTNVALMYGGVPYYDLLLIDSIYLKWVGANNATRGRLRNHYRQFFKLFAKRTILGEIEQNYFPKSDRLRVSNCVFGILFFSEYMQSFIKRFFPKMIGKLYIDCEKLRQPSSFWDSVDPTQSVSEFAAKAILGYATNPSFFTFSDRANSTGEICIDHIDFVSKKSIFKPETLKSRVAAHMKRIRINNYCRKNQIIRIPIKKLISLPFGQVDPKNPLPKTLALIDKNDHKFSGVLVLGGAEQNIILSTLINTYKWRKDQGGNSKSDNHYYGFAENVFDAKGLLQTEFHPEIAPSDVEYLIGTEGFVYGMPYRSILGKIKDIDNCRQAEVFKLVINSLPYYFIYG